MHRGRGVDASTGRHIKVDALDPTMPTPPTIEGVRLRYPSPHAHRQDMTAKNDHRKGCQRPVPAVVSALAASLPTTSTTLTTDPFPRGTNSADPRVQNALALDRP